MLATALYRANILDMVSPRCVLDWVGDDSERGVSLTMLLHFDDKQLGPVTRGLLARFGAESSVAHALTSQAKLAHRLVGNLADHHFEQARRAHAWGSDSNVGVRCWASALKDELERDAAWLLRHEHERRRYG